MKKMTKDEIKEHCLKTSCMYCDYYNYIHGASINKDCPYKKIKDEVIKEEAEIMRKELEIELKNKEYSIDMNKIKELEKDDKIFVSWLNVDGENVTKKCTFYAIEGDIILVKPPRKRKLAWEIPMDSKTKIEKI